MELRSNDVLLSERIQNPEHGALPKLSGLLSAVQNVAKQEPHLAMDNICLSCDAGR